MYNLTTILVANQSLISPNYNFPNTIRLQPNKIEFHSGIHNGVRANEEQKESIVQ